MALLLNLVLFFVAYLPAMAIASMILAGVLGDRIETSPDWDVGWNPILWLIVTAPWVLPTVVLVPFLHFLGRGLARRYSRLRARRILLAAVPVLFVVGTLILWGLENLRLEFTLPVAAAGVLYGAMLRIPEGRMR